MFPRVSPRTFWRFFFPRWRVSIDSNRSADDTVHRVATHSVLSVFEELQLDTSGSIIRRGSSLRTGLQNDDEEQWWEKKLRGRATLTGELRVFGETYVWQRNEHHARSIQLFRFFSSSRGSVFHAENMFWCGCIERNISVVLYLIFVSQLLAFLLFFGD